MKLKKILRLFPDLTVKGTKEVEVTSVTSNSKSASPGCLFVAKPGIRSHGARYIKEAVASGAVCLCTDVYDPLFPQITQILTPHPEKYESLLAAACYQYPSQHLLTIGITGTSGKTTTAYLAQHLLQRLALPAGLIGSIEYDTGAHKHLASHTTPDNPSLQHYLHEMVEAGKKAVVMEVTSHALAQGRVETIDFDVAVFTNLSQDHLDYHKTLQAYAQEKKKLFIRLAESSSAKKGEWKKMAVINVDSPYASQMVGDLPLPLLRFGKTEEADLQLISYEGSAKKGKLRLRYLDEIGEVDFPLIGEHNAYNLMAAIGICLSQGFAFKQVLAACKRFVQVPGRLETVEAGQPFAVYVDFAHKPDALERVLQAVRKKTDGKLYLIIGCGGDRDREKRPMMGKIASEGADFTFLADDNPRTENPKSILQEMAQGFVVDNYEIVGDRALAIQKAVDAAKPQDAILIAGKGHETRQTFAHHSIEFDDREVAKKAIQGKIKQIASVEGVDR